MGIGTLLYYILRIVKPYRWLLVVTLVLTLVGSLLAQVNAIVLDRAVDAINVLDQQPTLMWPSALRVLFIVSAVLLGKELLAAVVNFFRRYYGERMRILVSRDLTLQVVHHMQTFRMAFFTTSGNEAGRLQSRIDKGVLSTSRAVNSFFIDILPLLTSAVLALILRSGTAVSITLDSEREKKTGSVAILVYENEDEASKTPPATIVMPSGDSITAYTSENA